MTNIHKLTEHSEQVEKYAASQLDNPEDWVVLVGGFSGEYKVTAPEADRSAFAKDPAEMEEDPFESDGNGLFEIGPNAFSGDAFADDVDPVAEYNFEETMRTAFMQTLIVHKSILSEDVINHIYGEVTAEAEP